MATPTNIAIALTADNSRLRAETKRLSAQVARLQKREKRARNAITQLVESIEKSDKRGDYLTRIKETESRFIAADLIRANACAHAAKMYCYNDAERVGIVRDAETQASSLERDYILDGTPCPEKQHPWREWLREWGYR